MKKFIACMLAIGQLSCMSQAFADSRVGVCTDLGDTTINTEKILNEVIKTDADWIRFSTTAWRDCVTSDGSFLYPESEKELLKKIDDRGIKKISILGMGVPANTYYRTSEDKEKGITAMWYDLPVYIEGDDCAIEYWNAYTEAIENTVKAQIGLIDAYEVWNEPNHWGFNGYTKKCVTCDAEYEGYNSIPKACSCGGALEGFAVTSGKEYAKLYVAWREIVKNVYEEQGLEPVPVYCGSITGWENDENGSPKDYFSEYIDAISEIDGDLSKVDGITLHLYGKADSYWAVEAFSGYKKKLENSGFCGEVLMTETGLYTTSYSDKDQALDLISRTVFFETFLKNLKSAGLATEGDLLYYELADGGNNPDDPENNFGLIDFMYEEKEGAQTLTLLNKVLKGKELEAFSHEDEDGIISTSGSNKEIRVAEYKGNGDTAYLIFRHDDSSIFDFNTSVTLNVSGDEVRTYNYLGGLKEMIDKNPSSSKKFTGIKANNPTIVECVTYKSVIEWASFDEESSIVSFEGNFWNEDSYDSTTCTAEVLDKNGDIVARTTVNVNNDRFSDWVSVDAPAGEYTLRIGDSDNFDEVEFCITKTKKEENKTLPSIAGVTAVYNKYTKSVKVSGTVEDGVKNQMITVMAVPKEADLENLNPDALGAITEVVPGGGGAFVADIKIPKWYMGASKLYVSGTDVETVKNADFSIQESDFAYIGEFGGDEGTTVSTKVILRNFTSKNHKAVLLLSEYDKDGRVIDSHIKNITIPAKTYSPTIYELKDITPNDNTTKIRAYLWSDLDSKMMPLTEPIDIRK